MNKIFVSIFLIILFTTFISCSLDYSDATLSEERGKGIPDTVLHDVTYTTVRNYRPVLKVQADRSESYSDKHKAVLTNVYLTEFDNQGNPISNGNADKIEFNTENENADFIGNIHLYSRREEASITADNFYWDSENRVLNADPDDEVTVEQDSGSKIKGRNFSADMQTNIITFESPVKGTFITEDDNDE